MRYSEVKYKYEILLNHLWTCDFTSIYSNGFNIKSVKWFFKYYFLLTNIL